MTSSTPPPWPHVHDHAQTVSLTRHAHAGSLRTAHTNPTMAASARLRNEPKGRCGAAAAPTKYRPKHGRTQGRPTEAICAFRTNELSRGTNEPRLPPRSHSEIHERKSDRHERTDARDSHERNAPTAGVAVPVSPWPAPRRRRPRSSPPHACRRRCGAAPWCGRRWTGSPACRRRRPSGPW